MLVNGDKIVAKKRIGNVISEGEICKVVNVDEDIITFAFGNNFVHKGVMTFDEYAEYFEKYVEYTEETMTEVTAEWVENIINHSEITIENVGHIRKNTIDTVMKCVLPNGFEVYSSYTSSDENLNIDECRHEIFDEIFKLESYRLCCELYEKLGTDECPYDCNECPCEGCNADEYEEDECLDTDLDCDDCEDYYCPYNSNYK